MVLRCRRNSVLTVCVGPALAVRSSVVLGSAAVQDVCGRPETQERCPWSMHRQQQTRDTDSGPLLTYPDVGRLWIRKHPTQEGTHALLHRPSSILLRHRPSRSDHVPLHPGPREWRRASSSQPTLRPGPLPRGHRTLPHRTRRGHRVHDDKIDSHKIAVLLRAGALPQAYVYPAGMRATRDLLRRRLFFVRKRGELFAPVRTTFHQYNLPMPSGQLLYQSNRAKVPDAFRDPIVRASIESDLALAGHYDGLIRSMERTIREQAKVEDPSTLDLLQTIPGVGSILSLTLLYELHNISRFPRVQDFISYARLVKSQKSSAGKILGTSGAKIGNAHLKWAFSEAAVFFLKGNTRGQRHLDRLRQKHGKGKALSILAARLGRASYYMIRRNAPFDMDRFMN